MKSILNTFSELDCVYIIEIQPKLDKKSIQVVPIHAFDEILDRNDDSDATETETQPLYPNILRKHLSKSVLFQGLDPNLTHTIIVCTLLNGKQVGRHEIQFP